MISPADLDGYTGHLAFESVLQYVAIPNLRVENYPPEIRKKQPFWNSDGRKDYLAIFDWLREKGVKRILRVVVEDDEERPHSDEVIFQALQSFDVENLDWRKFDICSDVIVDAVPSARKLKLHCKGNNAVLRSWCANNGLVRLSKASENQKIRLILYPCFRNSANYPAWCPNSYRRYS